MENHTAKHFVLQLGSLISLYLSLAFLLVLVFGIIELIFPDIADSVWEIEQASSSVRIGIAMVLVFFPTYIVLTRVVNKARRSNSEADYSGFTKWLIYLSLLVGGGVLLGDLVVVMMTFLEGDLTQRFVLKVIAVLAIVGVAFNYYMLDVKGYWLSREKKSIRMGIVVSVLVLLALVSGLRYIDTPAEVREQSLDAVQVSDLMEMQWRVTAYLAVNNELPETLEDVYTEDVIPESPDGRGDYKYEVTEDGFNLCATFAAESRDDKFLYERPVPFMETGSKTPSVINTQGWAHGEGDFCFRNLLVTKDGEDEAE